MAGPSGLVFAKQTLQTFRVKELIMFMTGYIMREMQSICTDLSIEVLNVAMLERLNLIVEQANKILMSKLGIAEAFTCIINVIRQQKQAIKSKHMQLSWGQVQEIFANLIVYVFSLKQNYNELQLFQEALSEYIGKILTSLIKKSPLDSISQNQQEIVSMAAQSQIFNRANSIEQLSNICDICCLPLDQKTNQSIKDNLITRISNCNHHYHLKCLYQTIKNYIDNNGSVICQQKADQNQIEPLTLIKCPGYEHCSARLWFSQVHKIIVKYEHKQPNLNQSYLSKLHAVSFNDYINCHDVKPFNQMKKFVQSTQDHQKLQQNLRLFFCQTKGCSAIYEIDIKQSQLAQKNRSTGMIHSFMCLACQKPYCLQCFSQIHPTMTCKEFAISSSRLPQDQELQKFIKTLRKPYMKCPKCHFYVDNWRGCSTITCRCGIRFCYKCGGTSCPYAKCLKQIQKQEKNNVPEKKQ